MTKHRNTPSEVAEIGAIRALSFGAGEPERLGLFLAESGIGPETLRSAASDPQFLVSVLDFVLRDDDTVKAFASASQHPPPPTAAPREALGETPPEREVPGARPRQDKVSRQDKEPRQVKLPRQKP